MPNKRDQDARNRIRLVVNRGEVDKQSIQPTCHGGAPKPGNLLIRTLAPATESLSQRRISLNTFRGHSFLALGRRKPLWNIVAWSTTQIPVFMVCGQYGIPLASEKYWYRLIQTLLCRSV